jgi:protein-tyrosine phosphatase
MGVSVSPALSRLTELKWLRDLRHAPAARLHARRRRAAQAKLEGLNPHAILFICHGNICRSPFAAAAFMRACPPEIARSLRVASAGFIGPDRSTPTEGLDVASGLGVDLSAHRSTTLTADMLTEADLVVVMSEEQEREVLPRVRPSARVVLLGDLDPKPVKRRTILDPWGGSQAAFSASYERIERCVRELARIVFAAH